MRSVGGKEGRRKKQLLIWGWGWRREREQVRQSRDRANQSRVPTLAGRGTHHQRQHQRHQDSCQRQPFLPPNKNLPTPTCPWPE